MSAPPASRASRGVALALLSLLSLLSLGGLLGFTHVRMQRRPAWAVDRPQAAAPTPLARRVLWIIVDGLRRDAVEGMPTLRRLAAEGRRFDATSELPTLSQPNYTAMATGAEPEATGVRLNAGGPRFTGRTIVDTVGPAHVASYGDDSRWLGALFPAGRIVGTELAQRPEFERLLAATGEPARLFLAHFSAPDVTAHRVGAATSEYKAACAAVDATLARWVGLLDREQDAVLLVADHGHLDRGGHGGPEPEVRNGVLVLWGAGITPGGPAPARNRDVAATLASLLGAMAPPLSRGRDLLGRIPAPEAALPPAPELHVAALGFLLAILAVLLALAGATRKALAVAIVWSLLFWVAFAIRHDLSYSTVNKAVYFVPYLVVMAVLASAGAVLVARALRVHHEAVRVALLTAAVAGLPLVPVTLLYGLWAPVERLPAPSLQFLPVMAFASLGLAAASGALALLVRRPRAPRASR